jgi:hypothetical protein
MSELPPGGIRFTIPLLGDRFVFVRYPMDVTPPEGLIGFVNDDTWQTAGVYRDGAWRNMAGKPFKRKPTHWTAMVGSDG